MSVCVCVAGGWGVALRHGRQTQFAGKHVNEIKCFLLLMECGEWACVCVQVFRTADLNLVCV